ncbi:LmrA/YxaF family transcription factor [Streptosporangium nondiastaticum]|uniref:LmrA/YxaF family transcription factor n=1 Tax=Streptosporangium nondiastaticum TaxID=35764 RepID=UPI003F4AF31F
MTHGDQEFSALLRAALRGWEQLVHDKLLGPGIPAGDAQGPATTIISALEGAEVTVQVIRSEEPLCATGRQPARLVGSYGTPPVS